MHNPSAPSQELLPGREQRQPGNTEQFLLQKIHSVASTVILTTYSVSVKLLFMSMLRLSLFVAYDARTVIIWKRAET